MIWCKNPYI
jgi:hypothetical protein